MPRLAQWIRWVPLLTALTLGCTSRTAGIDDEGTGGDGDADAATYLKATTTRADQLFGTSVALSADGATLAVGAVWEASAATGVDGNQTDDSAPRAGAVHVFVRGEDGELSHQAYIKASNTDAGDRFGDNVALSRDGDTLAVSASLEASGATDVDGDQADDSVPEAGAVYVFVRDQDGLWSQQAYLKANGEANRLGSKMVLSGDGDTLVAVALSEPAVYVFGRDQDGLWSRQAKLNNVAEDGLDYFGAGLALSDDGATLALGGPGDDSEATGVDGDDSDNSAPDSGAVRVFVRSGQSQWSQQAYLKAPNTDPGDKFSSVALSANGHTLIVGAANEQSEATGVGGDQSDDSRDQAGAVYVFERDGQAQWSQRAYIKASNTGANDHFGAVVALSRDGATLAVGAYDEDSDATGIDGDQASDAADGAGAVYVFERGAADDWGQRAYVKASNTDAGDVFGFALALSSDGAVLAVGAPAEAGDGDDPADNSAANAGAVYLYDLVGEDG